MTQHRSKDFWQTHIDNCAHCELTQAEYCSRHQIALSTFSYWKRKLNGKDPDKPTFYPLTIPSAQPGSLDTTKTGVVVTLCSGRFFIELGKDFSCTALSKVVTVLEQL